jgi:hypothetical protein
MKRGTSDNKKEVTSPKLITTIDFVGDKKKKKGKKEDKRLKCCECHKRKTLPQFTRFPDTVENCYVCDKPVCRKCWDNIADGYNGYLKGFYLEYMENYKPWNDYCSGVDDDGPPCTRCFEKKIRKFIRDYKKTPEYIRKTSCCECGVQTIEIGSSHFYGDGGYHTRNKCYKCKPLKKNEMEITSGNRDIIEISKDGDDSSTTPSSDDDDEKGNKDYKSPSSGDEKESLPNKKDFTSKKFITKRTELIKKLRPLFDEFIRNHANDPKLNDLKSLERVLTRGFHDVVTTGSDSDDNEDSSSDTTIDNNDDKKKEEMEPILELKEKEEEKEEEDVVVAKKGIDKLTDIFENVWHKIYESHHVCYINVLHNT